MSTKSQLNPLPISLVQYQASTGNDYPLGASLDDDGCNFAIHAGDAKHIELCLFDHNENELARVVLPGKQGGIRFGHIAGIKAGQLYAYRVFGAYQPEHGLCYDPRKLILDPYAKAVTRPIIWDAKAYQDDDSQMVPKCIVCDDAFDWQGVSKPNIARQDTILYETHVRGFSQQKEDVEIAKRGTYLGLVEPSSIEHIKSLGVSSVQLLPIATFMSEPRLKSLGLSNYWGYNPILFMAPEPRYAQNDALTEFKTMVREFHRHGIEVILDVVFNHTAESGSDGPSLCYRGLDNKNYYLFEHIGDSPDYSQYVNNTGCGNSVSLDHPIGLRLVLDSLRYWVDEMQVDGFRFDLAVSLGRERNHYNNQAAFFKAIAQDPILSRAKMIAEPWDIGPNGYQLGHFPERWMECNDRFRDTSRGFWKGEHGLLGEMATRIMGSRDVFLSSRRSIHTSVNYICYHDGFTLEDIVSYEQRHNHANGEDNRDGHGHNISVNCGVEGATKDKKVLARRRKLKRNLLSTLMLSQGIPHFLGGDELSRSQQGNNNAYCQNNKLSWFNWQLDSEQQQFLAFTQQLIALRKRSRLFHYLQLENDSYEKCHHKHHSVRWFRPDGKHMHQEDWHQSHGWAVAVEMRSLRDAKERWLWIINACDHSIEFAIPAAENNHRWVQQLDTSSEQAIYPKQRRKPSIKLSKSSMLLLEQVSHD
ncbi:glycogen debranching protein GlgX [Agarivorans sp. MS3-6]|uniref:glycogen debranching protein GlgX n=1 Tax=Agarivorans sp. TSD2052 TaxID=2937286 RepID=UPI0020104437|nr:glycogen debranching protein GlgX [Agarivorans sp. TSD2052]UPW20431.1 glycogen debranching protein GlgX [Agarivorans sp. TSD2052]